MDSILLEDIKQLKAIADIGLLYSTDEYNQERYAELQEISIRLLSKVSSHEINSLKESFQLVHEYPTAKVDIRGLLLSSDKKVLLVQEKADNKWSLPGGWADIGQTPAEVIIKEFKEETGLEISPKALLAVFDKKIHAHPPQPFYVYKMVFYCEATSPELAKGFDMLDVQYFDINALPPLSEDRILKTQIELLYQKVLDSDFVAYYD